MRLISLSRIVAACALSAVALGVPSTATARTCEAVAFEENSDNGTGPITATGVGCKTARAVARKSNGKGPTGTPGTRRSYKSRGFSCSGVELDTALPSMKWVCKSGSARIRFEKS